MFGSSKKPEEKKAVGITLPNSSGALSALTKGTALEGTLNCENDLRVDGSIKGNLNCAAKLIIGATGSVNGEVKCQNAVIEGRFEGTLRVAEVLHIKENASVNGDIFTDRLVVQSGAKFNVACKMQESSNQKILGSNATTPTLAAGKA